MQYTRNVGSRVRSVHSPRRVGVILFLGALVIRLAWWVMEGTQVKGDSLDAISGCQLLFGAPFEWLGTHNVQYAGFRLPYCAVRWVSDGAVDYWIALQIVLSAFVPVLLYLTGRRLVGEMTGIVAGAAMVVTWETFRWVVRPQSEAMFTFLVALVLWSASKHVAEESSSARTLLLAALGWLALTRPFGIPIVLGFFAYDLLPTESRYRLNLFRSRLVPLSIIGVLIAVIPLSQVFDPQNSWNILRVWSDGIVVSQTFYYDYTPRAASNIVQFAVLNFDHMAIMAALKIAWFFVPVLGRWSMLHIVANMITIFPLVVGSIVGAVALYRRDRQLFALLLTPLAMMLLTISALFVDGGFNYRAQATPIFALLSGYAVEIGYRRNAPTLQGLRRRFQR